MGARVQSAWLLSLPGSCVPQDTLDQSVPASKEEKAEWGLETRLSF